MMTLLAILRAWWFDPFIASLSFLGFINLYWFYELKCGLTKFDGYVEWDLRFLMTAHTKSAIGYWIGIFLLGTIQGQTRTMEDGIPCCMSDLLYLTTEVVSGIVAYDFVFFFIHWAMHEVPSLRFMHAKHHDAESRQLLECNDVLRHSLLDGLIQVLVNIAVQQRTPWWCRKSRCARAIHNLLVAWMLTESHTTSPEPYIWRNWFVGVREHVYHHTGTDDGMLRYQQFFGYLDNLRLNYVVRHQRRRTAGKDL